MSTRLNTRETADYLRVSVSTIKRWRREGVGPEYLRIEGRISYEKTAIDQYIKDSKVAR